MKFRSDFVTNSSSSSFIIGKREDSSVTVDSVYQQLRLFYKNFMQNVESLKADMDKFGLIFKDGAFKYLDEDLTWDDRSKLDKKIEAKYGIDTWEYVPDVSGWIDFETYAEYQAYWARRIQEADPNKYVHAPFSIFDFSNPDTSYLSLEDGSYIFEAQADTIEMNRHIIGWYVPCVDDRIAGTFNPEEWDYCDRCPYRPIIGKKCYDLVDKIKSGEITATNCVSLILGKICIHSECGYIPDSIVEKLRDISSYCCNHMG